jgi:molybdopterin/thiamine biosynthesis adenylyltransferase
MSFACGEAGVPGGAATDVATIQARNATKAVRRNVPRWIMKISLLRM